MRTLFAIASKTIRSAIRSRVVHVILFFCVLTVLVLPMTIASDGTAKGLVQVSLTYTLGIIGALLSIVALWLGSVLMAEDIEGYQIHMVVSKPVSRLVFWFGKLLGLVVLLGGILLISATLILGMTYWRLHRANFPADEMQRLRSEVLVGRDLRKPEEPDIDDLVERELQMRLQREGGELGPNITLDMARQTIRTQLERSRGEIPFGNRRGWVFTGLPADDDEEFFSLRFRLYVDRAGKRTQSETQGFWFIRSPEDQDGKPVFTPPVPRRSMGGTFSELHIHRDYISKDGRFEIHYVNLDPARKSVVIEPKDGPHVMIAAVSFWNNFFRVVLLIFFQVIFMLALSCAAGATLSTPVAIFVSFAYVFIGVLVRYTRATTTAEKFVPQNLLLKMIMYVQDAAKAATVSLNDFIQVTPLTRGELIDLSVILTTFLTVVVLRGGIIGAIGLFGFTRRELGLVIRK